MDGRKSEFLICDKKNRLGLIIGAIILRIARHLVVIIVGLLLWIVLAYIRKMERGVASTIAVPLLILFREFAPRGGICLIQQNGKPYIKL